MTVHELVLKSRSYRGYNEKRQITKDELLSLVECARLCPSSVNKQPLKYYLAWEKDEVGMIQTLTRWARALPELELPHPGMRPTGFIIIVQDTQIDSNLTRYQRDVGIVAQTMLLAATERGLGGCMIGNFGALREALGLPERFSPMLVVALGEPAEEIVLTGTGPNGETDYYRDERDVHYVPKRELAELVLSRSK